MLDPEKENKIYEELISLTDPLHIDKDSPLFHHDDSESKVDPCDTLINLCISLTSFSELKFLNVHLEPKKVVIPQKHLNLKRFELPMREFNIPLASEVSAECILFELDTKDAKLEFAIPVNYFLNPKAYSDIPISGRKVMNFSEKYHKADVTIAKDLQRWTDPDFLPAGFHTQVANLPRTTSKFIDVMGSIQE